MYIGDFIQDVNKCEMPNLAAEIRLHCGAHPSTYADHANITMELLEAFLRGEEEITAAEFMGMVRLNGNPIQYLARKELLVYNLQDKADTHRVERIFEEGRRRLLECDPGYCFVESGLSHIEQLAKRRKVLLRAEINLVYHDIHMAELNMRCEKQKTNKRGIIKKITAPGGNLEAVTSQV